jgi:NAD(P)-dependent dehydrogenase (short-subunit alcohol dehydrogenase family)
VNGVVVVTGGGRGIGRAISLKVARDGHDIVVGYLNDAESAESVVAEIVAMGRRAVSVRVDTTDEGSVSGLFAAAERLGPVTGVVNNAGAATAIGRLDDNDLEAVRRDLDVNLYSVIVCCKLAVGPLTRAGGGSIVNISSAAATLGSPGMYVHYAAAKAGVDALTVGLSKELAPSIRVNVVAPGIIWSEFHRDPERPAKLAATIPLGRAGQTDEIAGAVAFLLSDAASYVTGANLRVAGGM